jgi:hypothetical protein
MNNGKIITIIGAVFTIFILIVGVLFFNSYLDKKNSALVGAQVENIPPEKSSAIVSSTPAVNNSASSSVATSTASLIETDAGLAKQKELIKSQLDAIKKTPLKTVADVYKDINSCAALNSDAEKNICVTLWAEFKNDPSLCLKNPEAERQACQDRAYIEKASTDKNINLCSSIVGGDAQMSCIAKVIKEASLTEKDCSSLSANASRVCLIDIIMAKVKAISDCDSITDASIKQYCRNNFYADLAK